MSKGDVGVRTRKPTASDRRGVTLITQLLLEDFENNFETLFPEATDEQILDICAAMDWLEQHSYDLL